MASELISTIRFSADRLSFFLQHLISIPIRKLNLYLNIKNWFTSVFMNAVPIEAGS